jgi:hypothetical protein
MRFCTALIHLPTLKKVAYYGRSNDFWFYDYAENKWTHVMPKGPGPYARDSEGVSCYDSKRARIYVLNRSKNNPGRFGIYDVASNTWIRSEAKLRPDVDCGGQYRSGAGVHYDSVNDVAVLRLVGKKKRGIYVYHPEKDEWDYRPDEPGCGGGHSFYSPELNAHFYFSAHDSNIKPGDISVYRYKR